LPYETQEFSIAEGSGFSAGLSQKPGGKDIKKGIEKIIKNKK
jgi:hypothetical protein